MILKSNRKWPAAFLLIILAIAGSRVYAQTDTTAQANQQVFVMELRSEIDARTNRYVELAFDKAEEIEADLIVIDMDTYGGALYDADDIRTRILESEIPVYVFINKDAASAGALISIACDSIYMAPGASIGAATVVSGGTGEAAPDKYQSYMRSIMRATAEATGRDPHIAEAMVDQNLEVDSISKAGEVITFSTSEAIKYGFCEAQVTSIEELLQRSGMEEEEYTLTVFEKDVPEQIIAFFLNPFISGILILIILGGVYFELQTPGVGFPLMAAIVALVLYLVPYYLNGLAENWEIVAFFVGAVLIILEVLVIPGFGVAGIAGLTLTIGSLILVMLNNNNFDFFFVDPGEVVSAVATTLIGMFGAILLMFFFGVRLTDSAAFKRVSLQTTQATSEGYTSSTRIGTFIGKEGEAYTVLRPSGKIMIDDELYDAYTRGDYIPRGERIVVVNDEGTSLRVKLSKDVPKEGLS
ncbi:NfeD family protein [Catalinimonas niigatensis]|uniref:NfeD family protein n=1 Tax=Catalinimonas niigatensis TaxID=1397264 RepID=UPI0026656BB5|nr:NfeD family protein [Catalinimonas niigatensis]WPP48505.1 NfeD family protein [Catalinimonas niigatensis]